MSYAFICASDMENDGYSKQCKGSVWFFDRGRCNGAYCDPGDIKYSGSNKDNTKYWCNTSIYKLWRNIGNFSYGGDGTCIIGIKRHKTGKYIVL